MINKSQILTILGFIGFTIGSLLLFYNSPSDISVFHEIVFEPKEIVRDILADKAKEEALKIEQLETQINKISDSGDTTKNDKKGEVKPSQLPNNIEVKTQLEKSKKILLDTRKYLAVSNVDSLKLAVLKKNLRALVNLEYLTELDTLSAKSNSVPINFIFEDTMFAGSLAQKLIPLPVHHYQKNVDFLSKYTGFGIWALMVIMFCTASIMVIGICFHFNDQSKIIHVHQTLPKTKYASSFALCILLMAVFIIVVISTFYDGFIVKDLYFFIGFGFRLKLIILIGYVAAVFCFSGMVNCSSQVSTFIKKYNLLITAKRIIDINVFVQTKKIENTTEDNQQKKTLLNEAGLTIEDKESKTEEIQNLDNSFLQLKNIFNQYFLSISLLLALLVFCTGTLYSAINSLDFVKMLTKDMGFSHVRNDFIFLYGTLHTLLILIFYLPAKYNFNRYAETHIINDPKSANDEEVKGFLKAFSGQFKSFSQTLIVGAPLVASFAQWLLDFIFNN